MPTIEQKRRSALHSRGCGCLRCSSCGRRQRFSAISITLDLNAVEIARPESEPPAPPTNPRQRPSPAIVNHETCGRSFCAPQICRCRNSPSEADRYRL